MELKTLLSRLSFIKNDIQAIGQFKDRKHTINCIALEVQELIDDIKEDGEVK